MSSETETQVAPPSPPAASGHLADLGSTRNQGAAYSGPKVGSDWESNGPQASLRRDQLFRRSLLLADMTAFVVAFVVLAKIFSRSPQLTWVSGCGLLALFLGAKIFGLYDRDETLIHKTTLDETPKLFQVATLGALCAWLAGGFVVAGGTLDRREALLLWLMLIVFLILTRATARALALRLAPIERCLFIGDRGAAKTIGSKLADHHGLKAELVDHLDPADVSAWSADAFSAPRLPEIRDLARSLDVQRAIVAPDSLEPDRMLDLVCTLEAVGVKITVLPRLLEVVGSSVEFDDLHGVTVMGVKRFALTRSSIAVKRAFDLTGALIGLLFLTPLIMVIAIAIKLDTKGPVFFRQRRVGRHGEHFEDAQVPDDGPRRRRAQGVPP